MQETVCRNWRLSVTAFPSRTLRDGSDQNQDFRALSGSVPVGVRVRMRNRTDGVTKWCLAISLAFSELYAHVESITARQLAFSVTESVVLPPLIGGVQHAPIHIHAAASTNPAFIATAMDRSDHRSRLSLVVLGLEYLAGLRWPTLIPDGK